MPPTISIHADSSYRLTPAPGGYAAIITGTGADNLPFQVTAYGGNPETTNQRMDLMSVIAALTTLDEEVSRGRIDHRHTVELQSHSLQIVNVFNPDWVSNSRKSYWQSTWRPPTGREIRDRDLWEALAQLHGRTQINYKWVKSDASDPIHNQAQMLANEQADLYETTARHDTNTLASAHQATADALGQTFDVKMAQDSIHVTTPLRYPDGSNIIVSIAPSQQAQSGYEVSDERYPTSLAVLRNHNLPPRSFTNMTGRTCTNLDLELRTGPPDPVITTTSPDAAGLPSAVLRVAQAVAQVTAALEYISHS